MPPQVIVQAIKKHADRRLVVGWAMLATEKGGKPYVDTQDEHIPQGVILDAAMEYMLNSRKSDDMHDESPVGEAAFAWPFLDGVGGDEFPLPAEKRGLGVMIRYPQAIFDKFVSGEYTGFSIGGFAAAKAMPEGMCPGCEKPNSECTCTTPVQKAKKYTALKLDFISAVTVPAQTPAIAVAVIKSGQPSEKKTMDPILAAVLTLSAAQFEVYKSLGSDRQKSFLEMTAGEKDVLVQKAADADPVVHTCKDGAVIRKSHGEIVLRMAKNNDTLLERVERQEAIAKAATYANKAREVFSHLPLTEGESIELLVALDSIKSDEKREKITKALGSVNEVNKGATAVRGLGGTGAINSRKSGASAEDQYNTEVEKYAKVNKVSLATAYNEFPKTAEGEALRDAYDDERMSREGGLGH